MDQSHEEPTPEPELRMLDRANLQSEREQTDESLRLEREKADHELEEELAAIEETADLILRRARIRADEVLAAARAKSDQELAAGATGPQPPRAETQEIIARERRREDQALTDERATADDTLRNERAQQVYLASLEREETDTDLFIERVASDDVLTTLDEVLRVASRDLRSILNMIVGSAELIEKDGSKEGQVDQVLLHARRIRRAGSRMSRRIEDLVDVAGLESGLQAVAMKVGDPGAMVAEVVAAFRAQASERGIAVEVEIVPPAPLAAFDAPRILKVLTSLLSNAIKFTPAGGTVTVRVERAGESVRFAVSDTGTGVSADRLEAVFDRFRRVTERESRGVALYVAKFIVQAHGGRMWAESKDGEGSTFYFSLPIHVA